MCGIDAIHEIILHLHKLASHADIMMQRKNENKEKERNFSDMRIHTMNE
jgi:hypothetical protein